MAVGGEDPERVPKLLQRVVEQLQVPGGRAVLHEPHGSDEDLAHQVRVFGVAVELLHPPERLPDQPLQVGILQLVTSSPGHLPSLSDARGFGATPGAQ